MDIKMGITKQTFLEGTDAEKLDSVITELTILLPRLTPQFRGNIEYCIKLLKEVKGNLE
jgi:hypothetical protein